MFNAAKDCVFLRVIFSFFRTSKNRQFTYRPLYYQPEADEQASRYSRSKPHRSRLANPDNSAAADDSIAGTGAGNEEQVPYRSTLRFRRQMAQQEAQQSNRRLLFIVFIMLSLLLLLFGELKKLIYLLPVFVPLLWWTFRRGANKQNAAGIQPHWHNPSEPAGADNSATKSADPTQAP